MSDVHSDLRVILHHRTSLRCSIISLVCACECCHHCICILLNLCLFFLDVPEFHALVGNEAADELQSSRDNPARASLALKKCFSRMMNCEKKVFVDQLNMLVKRVSEEGTKKILKCHF